MPRQHVRGPSAHACSQPHTHTHPCACVPNARSRAHTGAGEPLVPTDFVLEALAAPQDVLRSSSWLSLEEGRSSHPGRLSVLPCARPAGVTPGCTGLRAGGRGSLPGTMLCAWPGAHPCTAHAKGDHSPWKWYRQPARPPGACASRRQLSLGTPAPAMLTSKGGTWGSRGPGVPSLPSSLWGQ